MNKKLTTAFILLTLLFFQSCYNNPVALEPEQKIQVNSELYNDLGQIIESTNSPNHEELVCIDFIYPTTLHVFDENLVLINSVLIQNDQQFSDFLASLEETQSISISYPITTVLTSGVTFSINNNEELKEVIDQCKKDLDIIYCQNLIKRCLWKIGYTENADNSYLGGVFVEETGATLFTFNNDTYFGSWTVFYINDELHININLNTKTEIGDYFNFDWKVEYLDENSIKLTNQDRILRLDQFCDTNNSDCDNFNFTECELANNPKVAEFILDDYNDCIYKILRKESSKNKIIYFETFNDASNSTNPITSSEVYLNTSNNQTIYVRIENIESGNYVIIEITIEAKTC